MISNEKEQLIFACLLAFFIRLLLGYFTHGFLFIDEVRQYLDVATFWHSGYGELSWEWVSPQIRSAIVPQILTIILKGNTFLGIHDPHSHIFVIRILLSLWSELLIISSYYIIKILYPDNKWAPFMSAMLCAVWGNLIYFNLRTLGECMAIPAIMGSLWLLLHSQKQSKPWISFGSGLLIGIAFIIKYQAGIIIFSSALYLIFTKDLRKFIYLSLGFLLGIGIQGISDWVTYGAFLKSVISYFNYNILYPAAHGVPTSPMNRVLEFLFRMHFPLLFPFMLYFTFKNFKKHLLLSLTIVIYGGIHLLLSNRQFRFYAPLLPLFLITSLASFMEWLPSVHTHKTHLRIKQVIYTLGTIAIISQFSSFIYPDIFRPNWNNGGNLCRALAFVGKQADSTGILSVTGSEALFFYVGKNIPLLYEETLTEAKNRQDYLKANYLLLNTHNKLEKNDSLSQDKEKYKALFSTDKPPFKAFGNILIYKRKN